MKYIFFGSPRFAQIILQKLIDAGLPPLAIVASPDSETGRKRVITAPPTKTVGEKNSIPVFQPERLRDFNVPPIFSEADFFVVAAYAKIIPKTLLELPRLGTVGIHPSLLPYFRGATPIQSAILNGAKETGVSIYKMDAEVDHGPVIGIASLKNYLADNSDYEDLEEKLALLGAETFIKVIPDYLSGQTLPTPQKEEDASFTKKFKTEDAFVSEEDLRLALRGEDHETTLQVLRKILAFSHEPVAWTMLEAPLVLQTYTLPIKKRIRLVTALLEEGKLSLQSFQVEGKKIVKL